MALEIQRITIMRTDQGERDLEMQKQSQIALWAGERSGDFRVQSAAIPTGSTSNQPQNKIFLKSLKF